jgi:hypothetical protein
MEFSQLWEEYSSNSYASPVVGGAYLTVGGAYQVGWNFKHGRRSSIAGISSTV